MYSVMQGPASFGTQKSAPNPSFSPEYYAEATPADQAKVISCGQKTDFDMIAELLNKLPMPKPAHVIDERSVQASHTVIRPPPGLSLPGAYLPQGQPTFGPHKSHLGMKGVYGFSRAGDDEQSSTNDDGEHDSCTTSSWEDEAGCYTEASDGLPKSTATYKWRTDSHSLPQLSPKINSDCSTTSTSAKPGPRGLTTLMVRNVPVMYTQHLLLKEWRNDGIYDFLYLPRSTVGQTNLSFAFINFVSEAHALAFKEKWHKKRMSRFTARKPLNISFADVQGLRANILQVSRKRVSSSEVPRTQPHIVVNGRCMEPQEALAVINY